MHLFGRLYNLQLQNQPQKPPQRLSHSVEATAVATTEGAEATAEAAEMILW